MSILSRTKGNGTTGPVGTTTPAAQRLGNAAREDEIRRRAYEIYVEAGEQPGSQLDDWLQAERELQIDGLAEAS